ncbi:YceI family protein [bacterium AH-315-A23]|nr:YceI family protein [bacterium AH-315-A23]
MKKSAVISLLLIASVITFSCKQHEKKDVKPIKKVYAVEAKSTAINWVAYKTTKKLPVKGQFTKVTIENTKNASTVLEALNGLKFNIPISSLVTNDTIRDGKLKKFFFGTMKNTNNISGTLTMNNETSGLVELTMNGISKILPITCVIDNQMVKIEAEMDLDNWQAQLAIKALNIACKDLHTGDDGISKTWNDVKIEVITNLKYE